MGIYGLPKLIQKIAADNAICKYNLQHFRDKKCIVAVDASLMIHQTVTAIRARTSDLKNIQGELTSHLYGIFYKTIMMLQATILPIFVFDNQPHEIKAQTCQYRAACKRDAKTRMADAALNTIEWRRDYRASYSISRQDVANAQKLLRYMGVPYIVAPSEADPVCAWLTQRRDANGHRYAKAVCSDDSDMLAFGGRYLFKNMMKSKQQIIVINLEKARQYMHLTCDMFVDLCVLLGNDYNANIPGMGPVNAYKSIVKHGSLEVVLDAAGDAVTLEMRERMLDARKYFKNAVDDLDNNADFLHDLRDVSQTACQPEKIIEIYV